MYIKTIFYRIEHLEELNMRVIVKRKEAKEEREKRKKGREERQWNTRSIILTRLYIVPDFDSKVILKLASILQVQSH